MQSLTVAGAGGDAVAAVGAVLPVGATLAAGVHIKRTGLLARGQAFAGAVFCLPANAQAWGLCGQASGSSTKQHRLGAHKAAPQPFARGKFQQQGCQRHGNGPK